MSFHEKNFLLNFNSYLKNIDIIKSKIVNKNNNINDNDNDKVNEIHDINNDNINDNDIKKRIFMINKLLKMTKDPNICNSNCIQDLINDNNLIINQGINPSYKNSFNNFNNDNNIKSNNISIINGNNINNNNNNIDLNFNNNNNKYYNSNDNKNNNINALKILSYNDKYENSNSNNNYFKFKFIDEFRIFSFIENDLLLRMNILEDNRNMQNILNKAFNDSINILK
jgi:hypothetical protein